MTPTLNAGKYVEDAIRCVEAQHYVNHEHIIVDGGSTDSTISLLRKYEHLRGFRWMSEPDLGIYDAINKGLRMSNGEIQSFLSADDLYPPWSLGRVVEAFSRDTSVDIVYGDGMIAALGGKYAVIYFNPPELGLKSFLKINTPATNPFFWKRRVFEEIGGYDINYRIAGDYDFIARAVPRFKFTRVEEVLTLWRFRPQSTTSDREGVVDENSEINRKTGGIFSRERLPLVYARLAARYIRDSYPEFARFALVCFAKEDQGRYGNLVGSRSVSRPRLLRDVLVPLLPLFLLTTRMRTRFFPGYIRTATLREFLYSSP